MHHTVVLFMEFLHPLEGFQFILYLLHDKMVEKCEVLLVQTKNFVTHIHLLEILQCLYNYTLYYGLCFKNQLCYFF
jgi:hypothetical protein